MFRALTAEAQHDPVLAARLRAMHLERQRERDRLPLERAVERGGLSADADLDALVDRLVGPIYYRALITGQEITDGYVDELVGAIRV